MSLQYLRKRAAKVGVKIQAESDDFGWGYWLLDAKTNDGVWEDENFCTSHEEIQYKLHRIEAERP